MNKSVVSSMLTKTYGEGHAEVRAVQSVDLVLKEGEMVGLFGPSGSGKTTLLSLIGCMLHPTTGSLNIYNTETTSLGEAELTEIRKKYISFIFQGFNLFPALTAYENIRLVLRIKRRQGIDGDRKVKDLLADVGLSKRMYFLPRDLSGGEKQRVSIARALVADSPIILADEPTASLDQANGRKVMEILKRFTIEQKKCVVAATHDTRLEDIFDRIITIEDGRIIKDERTWL